MLRLEHVAGVFVQQARRTQARARLAQARVLERRAGAGRVLAEGLGGIAWQAGSVILLDREDAIARAEQAGLFLWSRP